MHNHAASNPAPTIVSSHQQDPGIYANTQLSIYMTLCNHAATACTVSRLPVPSLPSSQSTILPMHNHAVPSVPPMLNNSTCTSMPFQLTMLPALHPHAQSPCMLLMHTTQAVLIPPWPTCSHQLPMVHVHTVIQFPTSHIMSYICMHNQEAMSLQF